MTSNKIIYLDYTSTTPTDKKVLEQMLPWFTEKFGNPHSRNHSFGWEAEEAVNLARKQVAEAINAEAKDIIFTSGATEANNLALKGVVNFYKETKNHIITVKTEHKSILDTARHMELSGFPITYLSVDENGLINLEELKQSITEKTALISVMAVNNETGVIQPLKQIGKIAKESGIFFHVDAVQALGKIPLDVEDIDADLMSFSSHKIYGPKGIGALFVRRKGKRVRLQAEINGGGQERGMRSGTLPTPLIVGFGFAAKLAVEIMPNETKRIQELSDKFLQKLNANIPLIYINGGGAPKVPNILNISFAGVEGEAMMMAVNSLALSSGSACTSESLENSYVLREMGVREDLQNTALRFSIGRCTTEDDLNYASDLLIEKVTILREMSPLWELIQEGIDLTTIKWTEH